MKQAEPAVIFFTSVGLNYSMLLCCVGQLFLFVSKGRRFPFLARKHNYLAVKFHCARSQCKTYNNFFSALCASAVQVLDYLVQESSSENHIRN